MRLKAVLGIFVFFLAAACQPRLAMPPADGDSRAKRLLSRLSHQNQQLESFKGIGRIRLWQPTGKQTARIAWLAALDGRIRAEILGPSGRPLLKLAYDGRHFYYFQAGETGIKKRRMKNPSLQRLISVPVTARELVFFLAGRPPVYEHGAISLSGGPESERMLTLEHWWSGVTQKIRLLRKSEQVAGVQVFAGKALRYRAGLSGYRRMDGFLIPSRIVVANGEGAGLEIRVDRFWANVALSADQFVISPS